MSKPEQLRGADRRRFHYIYKTTCLVTSRYYIGMHSTDSLTDGYIGSGQRLWHSIRKHGKENHKAEIVEHLATREALVLREAAIVDKALLKDPLCMNLVLGGKGDWGWGATSTEERQAARIKKMSDAWSKPGYRENFAAKTTGRTRSDEAKAKMSARWNPERKEQVTKRLLAVTAERFKNYWLTHDTPEEKLANQRAEQGYQLPDRSALSKQGWIKLAANEAKLATAKKAMSAAKRGKAWMNLEGVVKLIELDQEQSYLEQGWRRGTGNRQKVKEVSAETRAKLAKAARAQHARSRQL